jgi:hypothetical protein
MPAFALGNISRKGAKAQSKVPSFSSLRLCAFAGNAF